MKEVELLKNLMHTSVFVQTEVGTVQNSLNPLEEELLALYHVEFSHRQNICYFAENQNSVIQQDSYLFFWITVPEFMDGKLHLMYTIGPFTDLVRTDEWFADSSISLNLKKLLTGLPATSYKQMYHLAEALYQTLNFTSAPVVSLYSDSHPDAPLSEYTNDSYILGSTRNYAYEKVLVHGIQEGLGNDAINKQLKSLSSHRFLEDAPFRLYKNYFIGIAHILSFAVCDVGVPETKSFTICDHYTQAAESCKNVSQLDLLWNPLRDAYINLVETYHQHQSFSKPVRAALEYIGKNLREKFVLADMAAEIGYHPYYLSRLFQKETDMTINEYINTERLYQSIFYLRFTTMGILQVSDLVGFSSQSSFSTAFKKKFDMTPKQFRDNYR